MNHRFNEASSEIIVAFSCLHPKNSFSKFDVDKLTSLTETYRGDFSSGDRAIIGDQLKTYILHVRRSHLVLVKILKVWLQRWLKPKNIWFFHWLQTHRAGFVIAGLNSIG
jgi:hypothetical protein